MSRDRAGKPPVRMAVVMGMLRDGHSPGEIAERFSCAAETVNKIIRENGMRRTVDPPRPHCLREPLLQRVYTDEYGRVIKVFAPRYALGILPENRSSFSDLDEMVCPADEGGGP